jgi:hypothetical protein
MMQLDVTLASAELRADLADANQIFFNWDLNAYEKAWRFWTRRSMRGWSK